MTNIEGWHQWNVHIPGIIEEPAFTEQLSKLGGVAEINGALSAILWGVLSAPEKLPLVPGSESLRIIKTKRIITGGSTIPPLRVYFSFEKENERKTLTLHWIEEYGID